MVNAIVHINLIFLISFSLAGAGEMPVSTGSAYFIDEDKIEEAIGKAKKNDLEAILSLYRHYKFSALDTEKSIIWLSKAASLDDPISQYNLSMHFLRAGELDKALLWANKSMENGEEDALELIEEIKEKMVNPE